jgi:hypothetical protein
LLALVSVVEICQYSGVSAHGFPDEVRERLAFYVYLLIDPRDSEIFYVGKGVNDRVFHHAAAAVDDSGVMSAKLDRIRAIHADGHQVRHELLRFGLTEREAFQVEAAAIQLVGITDLTNEVAGHHVGIRGRMSTEVAISIFAAEPCPTIDEPVLLIRIPKLWHPAMTELDLLEATSGWWKLGPRRAKARYAFAVSKGVIREVYSIDAASWREQAPGDRGFDPTSSTIRWGFDGIPAGGAMSRYRNTSVKHLFKPGAQSPTLYLNC